MNPQNLKRNYMLVAIVAILTLCAWVFMTGTEDAWKLEQYELRIRRGEQLDRHEQLIYCKLLQQIKGLQPQQCNSLLDAYTHSVVATMATKEVEEVYSEALETKVSVAPNVLISSITAKSPSNDDPYGKSIALLSACYDMQRIIREMEVRGRINSRTYFSADVAGYKMQLEVDEHDGKYALSSFSIK